jgi:hypothetical protein
MQLTNMAQALPEWNTSFDDLCIQFPARGDCPTNDTSSWFKTQKKSNESGVGNKAKFEESHMNEEWRKKWNANNKEQS